MILWQGLGFLVAVIVFGCSLAANLIVDAAYGEGYYTHHRWPLAIALLCAAGACWILRRPWLRRV